MASSQFAQTQKKAEKVTVTVITARHQTILPEAQAIRLRHELPLYYYTIDEKSWLNIRSQYRRGWRWGMGMEMRIKTVIN